MSRSDSWPSGSWPCATPPDPFGVSARVCGVKEKASDTMYRPVSGKVDRFVVDGCALSVSTMKGREPLGGETHESTNTTATEGCVASISTMEGDNNNDRRCPLFSSKSVRRMTDQRRRSSFDASLCPLKATIVFVDLEGYSQHKDMHQRQLTTDFMTTLRNLLAFLYDELPSRSKIDNFVILPTGDGAAVIVIQPPKKTLQVNMDEDDGQSQAELTGILCKHCNQLCLRTTEEVALWLGSSLLVWALELDVGLRVGLNSGDLNIVEDPYGDPNFCGDAINMAARIMDTALPNQILLSSQTVVPQLEMLLASDLAESNLYGHLNRDCPCCPHMKFEIASSPCEVVVKHGVTQQVQSVVVDLRLFPRLEDFPVELQPSKSSPAVFGNIQDPVHPLVKIKDNIKKQSFASLSSLQPSGSSFSRGMNMRESATRHQSPSSSSTTSRNDSWNLSEGADAYKPSGNEILVVEKQPLRGKFLATKKVGSHQAPSTKWYMKIKPTEMQASGEGGQIKPKVLPLELIRRHSTIAFVGILHDNLEKGFTRILDSDPSHRWAGIYIFFPSDRCLQDSLSQNYSKPVEELIVAKHGCRERLHKILEPVVDDLRFLICDELKHCGSYWDWRHPGGFIHISPLTWGANPKTCPAMNYYWNSNIPSPEYRVYREGLDYLLETAEPLITH
mmetsp:Transcript_32911/g.78602  ORF Transcript_32911/g.78602 Transcript_32911/m.78602 type:complete len:674 (-) Transcript_32911:140-2161(-)